MHADSDLIDQLIASNVLGSDTRTGHTTLRHGIPWTDLMTHWS